MRRRARQALWLVAMAAIPLLAGCRQPAATYEVQWLAGRSEAERTRRIATHLRGLDMAMVEIGHRYVELYWAGQDRNWPYAVYQAGKMKTALANGVERRPRRAASARVFEPPLAAVLAASEAQDAARFDAAFGGLTAACNACHVAEQFAFLTVTPPAVRATVWAAPGPGTGAPASPPGR